ncbi:MAG: hypothetical protein BWY67_02222 [Bacteroidetes bacterium ADurb.Bin397]|nr:MAG: hypothetical protein BWY67_02222 [Bacteroidetes bacterium ADurb.Bin397]
MLAAFTLPRLNFFAKLRLYRWSIGADCSFAIQVFGNSLANSICCSVVSPEILVGKSPGKSLLPLSIPNQSVLLLDARLNVLKVVLLRTPSVTPAEI